MLQYKHYHDDRLGYVDAYSAAVTEKDGDVLSFLRSFKRHNDVCFSYLPTDGMGYLMQSREDAYVFNHALRVDLSSWPGGYVAEYIGQLDTSYRGEASADGYLPDGKLPSRRGAFGLQLATGLNPIFAQAVEVLLYTDKTLVLTGPDSAELIKYLKVICALFPEQYANSLGIVACPSSWGVVIDGAHPLASRIRIVAVDTTYDDLTRFGNSFVFLDVRKPATVSDELHPYAKAVQDISQMLVSGQAQRINGLIRAVCGAFDASGNVDHDQLAVALLVYAFDSNRCAQTAITLLQAYQPDGQGRIASYKLADAIKEVLAGAEMTEELDQLIRTARLNPDVEQFAKSDCEKYAFGRVCAGEPVSASVNRDATNYLDKQDAEVLTPDSELLSPWFTGIRTLNIFDFLCGAYANSQRPEILSLIYRYVHVQQVYNYPPQKNGESFDAALFDIAALYSPVRDDLIGAILLSCYVHAVVGFEGHGYLTQNRIYALESCILKECATTTERIMRVVALKAAVERVADGCLEDVRGADDFDFLPEEWLCKNLVNQLSFEDSLDLMLKHEYEIDSYVKLRKHLIDKLADLEAIKRIGDSASSNRLYKNYQDFFNKNKTNLQHSADIEKVLESLNLAHETNQIIVEYRRSFVHGCYETFTAKQKEEARQHAIRKKGADANRLTNEKDVDALFVNSLSRDNEKSPELRTQVSEAIIDLYRANSKVKKYGGQSKNVTFFGYAVLSGLLIVVLSAILFLVSPVTISVLLDFGPEQIIARVLDFLGGHHFLVLLVAMVSSVLTYYVHWKNSKHDRKTALRKAWLAGLIMGIIPVLVYTIVYMLTYMVL